MISIDTGDVTVGEDEEAVMSGASESDEEELREEEEHTRYQNPFLLLDQQ